MTRSILHMFRWKRFNFVRNLCVCSCVELGTRIDLGVVGIRNTRSYIVKKKRTKSDETENRAWEGKKEEENEEREREKKVKRKSEKLSSLLSPLPLSPQRQRGKLISARFLGRKDRGKRKEKKKRRMFLRTWQRIYLAKWIISFET